VDRLLKQTLGGGYRLMVNRRRDGRAGAAVSFYLPLERNG
jgi:two-component system LytT family sensor kinase